MNGGGRSNISSGLAQWAALLACFFHATIAAAQAPELTAVSPASARPGETVTVTFQGKNDWVEPLSIWSSFGAKAELARANAADKPNAKVDKKKLTAQLTLPAGAPLGIGMLRVCTTKGLSDPVMFVVDDLPLVTGKSTVARERATELTLPTAVQRHTDSGAADSYTFRMTTGQSVSVEIFAARLASKLDATLRLLDLAGKELAFCDDTPGLGGDCQLRYTAAADGYVVLEVRDVAYAGSADRFYHLRIGDFPLASGVFPPLVQDDAETQVLAVGQCVDGALPLRVSSPAGAKGMASLAVRFADSKPAAFVEVAYSAAAPVMEIEPNGTPAEATILAAPGTVVGQFARPGDRDWFQFAAKKGDRFRLDFESRDLGSPGEVYVRVESEAGDILAETDGLSEAGLEFAARADGHCRLVVEELNHRGGSGYLYAVTIKPVGPSFTLTAPDDGFFLTQGAALSLKVTAKRANMKAPILLELVSPDADPLPPGVSLEQNEIAAAKNDTELKITLPADVPAGTVFAAQIVGRAKVGEQEISATATTPLLKAPAKSRLIALPRAPLLLRESIVIGVGPKANP